MNWIQIVVALLFLIALLLVASVLIRVRASRRKPIESVITLSNANDVLNFRGCDRVILNDGSGSKTVTVVGINHDKGTITVQ